MAAVLDQSAYTEFVSPEAMRELTGAAQHKRQFEALRAMGLRPFPGRSGRPMVTWAAVNSIMIGQQSGEGGHRVEPNFEALDDGT